MNNELLISKAICPDQTHLSIINRVQLVQELSTLAENIPPQCVGVISVDVSHIKHMDSMAIAVFVSFQKELVSKNIVFRMVTSETVYAMFNMLHITSLLGCEISSDPNTNRD